MNTSFINTNPKNRYSKTQRILLPALFIAFIGTMFVIELVLPDRSFSETENRSLTAFQAPTFHTVLNGKFMDHADSYLSDQTPFRDEWVQLHACLETISGKKDVEGICRTDAGNLIALLPESDTTIAQNNINYIQNFARETGLPLYFGLIPTAADVLSEQLPAGTPTMDEEAMIGKLYGMCSEGSLNQLDLRTALRSHKEEYIYYRTDHHWTSLGACYGANVLLEAMNSSASCKTAATDQPESPNKNSDHKKEHPFELLNPAKLEKTTVSKSFYGTNCSHSGIFSVTPDDIDTYISADSVEVTSWYSTVPQTGMLYDTETLTKKDQYAYFLGGNIPVCEIKTQAAGPRLLLIRDSYSSSMIPFLTKYFSEIHAVDMRYCRMSMNDYVKEHEIDDVAVIYSLKTFMEDANLVFLNK